MTVTTTVLQLTLPATPTCVRRARDSVGEAVEELGGCNRLTDDIRLCVSEAVTNVVRHAYGAPSRGAVDVVVERDDGELVVAVRDAGRGMTGSRPRPSTGGHGLKIIDRLSRRCDIRSRRGVGTEVRMVFALGADTTAP